MKTYKCGYLAVLADFIQEIKNHQQENTWLLEFFDCLQIYLKELKIVLQNGILAIKSYDNALYKNLSKIVSETYNDFQFQDDDQAVSVAGFELSKKSSNIQLDFLCDKLLFLRYVLDSNNMIFKSFPSDDLIFLNQSRVCVIDG